MKYLLDTNVISETRKSRRHPGVDRWLATTHPDDLYLSVITVGELAKGIERKRRRDKRQAAVLEDFLSLVREDYAERIVDVDLRTALVWGRLGPDQQMNPVDALLAATALVRDWTLVTRNTRHVERSGVKLLDPFQS